MTVQMHEDGTGVCEKCNQQFRRLASGALTPHFDVENQRHCPGGFIPKSEPHSKVGFKRIPGSRFAICGGCHEEHLLTRADVMSTHENSSGQRCEGSATPEQIYEMEFAKTPRPRQTIHPEEANDSGVPLHIWAEANKSRRSSEDRGPQSQKFDRSIYAVRNVHTVNGGSPTLGRTAR